LSKQQRKRTKEKIMTILLVILTIIHVAIALVLIGLVLMQKSSEQGVGAAFGAGMTDTMFGAGTTTVLQKMTIYCAITLFVTTVSLAMIQARRSGRSNASLMQKVIETTPAPASGPAAAPLNSLTPPPATTAPATNAAPAPAK
jgi:preprotein translocase subunit SecG